MAANNLARLYATTDSSSNSCILGFGFSHCFIAADGDTTRGRFDSSLNGPDCTDMELAGDGLYACKGPSQLKFGKDVCYGLSEFRRGFNDFVCTEVSYVTSNIVVGTCAWDNDTETCTPADDRRQVPVVNIELQVFCQDRGYVTFEECTNDRECVWTVEGTTAEVLNTYCMNRAYSATNARDCEAYGWDYNTFCFPPAVPGCAGVTLINYERDCAKFVQDAYKCGPNPDETACIVTNVKVDRDYEGSSSALLSGLLATAIVFLF